MIAEKDALGYWLYPKCEDDKEDYAKTCKGFFC
jgi:hypothetical protein